MRHAPSAHRLVWLILAVMICIGYGCRTTDTRAAPRSPESVRSLLGEPLPLLTLDDEQRATLEDNLTQAQRDYEADPDDEMNIIWLGRRLAYLGRYHEAIDVFSRGVAGHPDSYRLLRHRGHRFITTRQLGRAVADLSNAAALAEDMPDQVESDGAPNADGIPTSTTHTNIYYHLGLAHYLQGEFDLALEAYQTCLEYCTNNDITVATTYWLFLTARRTGQMDIAVAAIEPITADMHLLENHDYHRLLMLYKGHVREAELLEDIGAGDLSSSTLLYGIAMQRLINGDEDGARELFQRIIDTGFWPAFGYIATEAELSRMR